ncbi:MAG TPA: DUF2147 domain-containing protein [Bacteroidales bacterium]|jgi:uncharacterized protein (DUF2147 family)|nr:DUF2147 domain-containing protein [Bacteroidales bacterium]
MKYILIASVAMLAWLWPQQTQAQVKPDNIVGFYITYDDDTGAEKSQVQIFKSTNGKYYGKIVWLKEPLKNGKPKVDDKNPEAKLQNRPIIGLEILKGFVFDKDDKEWNDGTIYNPSSGKTYSCYINFESPTKIKIRGYIGASWMGLGKTAYWTKEPAQRK